MIRAAILALLAMSACGAAPNLPRATGGAAAPASVTLYRDNVVVQMSDGSVCTGVREARAGPWTTALKGCPHTWPVAVLRPTALPRLPLVPTTQSPWVTITPPEQGVLGFGPRVGT